MSGIDYVLWDPTGHKDCFPEEDTPTEMDYMLLLI